MDLWSVEVTDSGVVVGSAKAKAFIPDPDGDNVLGAAVGELLWPPQAPGVIVSAAHGGRRSLTVGTVDVATLEYKQRQTLVLAVDEHDGAEEFHMHLALSPDARTLVAANTLRSEVYVVRLDAAAGKFLWAAPFAVGAPMLSAALVFPEDAGGAAGSGCVESEARLYCQQTAAIAMYTVDFASCEPAEGAAAPAEAAPKAEAACAEADEVEEKVAEETAGPRDATAPAEPAPPPPVSIPEPALAPKTPTTPSGVASGRFPPPPDTPGMPRTPPPTPAGGVLESEPVGLPIAGLRLLQSATRSGSSEKGLGENGSPSSTADGVGAMQQAAPRPQPPKPHVSFSDERRSEPRAPQPPRPHVSFSDERLASTAERVPQPPRPHVSFSDGTAPGQPVPSEPPASQALAGPSRVPGQAASGPIITEGSVAKRLSATGGDSAVLSELQQLEGRLLSALSAKMDALSKQQEAAAQRRDQQVGAKIAAVLSKDLPKLLDASAKSQARGQELFSAHRAG